MDLKLSDREREIAILLSDDKTVKKAGQILDISIFTVQAHVRQMRAKFGKRTIAGLIAELFRKELIK